MINDIWGQYHNYHQAIFLNIEVTLYSPNTRNLGLVVAALSFIVCMNLTQLSHSEPWVFSFETLS